MKTHFLSLVLVLLAVFAGFETAQASNPSISIDDCLALFDNSKYETVLKNRGFVKVELDDEDMDYDHFYRYVSKKDGIVIEIYGEYCDTSGTDYVDIYFSTPSEAFFFIPNEEDKKWRYNNKSDYDSATYSHKNGIIMKRLGRLVEFKIEYEYR